MRQYRQCECDRGWRGSVSWKQSSGDPWTTVTSNINVPVGATRQFQALPNPAGATWPTGKPAWSGSSGVSGTGETKSVTFDTTSTSATDYKTVNCECGNTVTLNAIVVGIKATQWSEAGNDPWTTITTTALYVPMNVTRYFRVLPAPFDATWPSGNPAWNVDGITTGTGSSKTISFYNIPPTHRTVAVGCGGTTFTRQVYTVKSGFAQSSAQVCCFDDFTTQPVAGPWKLIACNGTDYVDAITTPSSGAPHVYFSSSTTSTLTVSPTQAGSSPQQLTLHCNTATTGSTAQVHSRLDSVNGYNLSTLNVIAYTTKTLSVAFRVIDEENDDIQVIGLGGGGGVPDQICVSAGPNGFRDTNTLGGDDQISGTNILTGSNGICETTANNTNLHSTCTYNATTLKNYLRTVYLPALADVTTVTQLTTMAVNYDLNRDTLLDTTSWTTQEMNVIINNCDDINYDYIIYLVDDGSESYGLGFMGLNQKYGFVHVNMCTGDCDPLQVTAHELGHGAFRLEHTDVTQGYAYNDPDNLMWPFANGAPTALRKDQWDIIH